MVAGGWREGGCVCVTASGYGVSIWDDENVLELDRGDGCTTLLNLLKPIESYTLNG